MKFISEYRNPEIVKNLIHSIQQESKSEIALMEVCGGHTMAIHKFGIPSLLPENIKLISGPGCPVCVTSRGFIDHAVALCRRSDVILTTFGDLIRVPGSTSTLYRERAAGADVRIVYSPLDAVQIAVENPDKKIVFLGIGFETTAPGSAAAIDVAEKKSVKNFFLLSSHKTMPPAMQAIVTEGIRLDGFICPGHVSTITGTSIYNFIPEKFNLGCVVAGFEPTDILQSVLMLVKQIESKNTKVEIQYSRAVKPEGNVKARVLLDQVFELCDDWWRGFGVIPASGMTLRSKYAAMNALNIEVEIEPLLEEKGCICGEILKGMKTPKDCKLFGKACTPENPSGSCMVSNEGACAAFYRYSK
ncbi:MAG: hydrogenase formation protein HypD [Bacteroidota bacterium]